MSVAVHGTPSVDDTFGTTGALPIPAGSSNGDLLVAIVCNSPSGGGATINTPSGWTQVAQVEIDNGVTFSRTVCSAVFIRFKDGTEGSSLACTGTSSGHTPGFSGIMVSLSGVDTTTPVTLTSGVGYSSNSANAAGTTVTATGISGAQVGGMLLGSVASWETDRGPLSTMSNVANLSGDGCTLSNLAISSSGATGNKTVACSSTEIWVAFLLAVNPASGGGGTNTPVGVNATETQTPTRARNVAKTISVGNTQTPSRARAAGQSRSATQTQTPSQTNGHNTAKNLSATQTQTPSVIRGSVFTRALSATATQTATRVRGAGKPSAVTHTQTPSRGRTIGKPIAASESQSTSSAPQLSQNVPLSATSTQTSTDQRAVAVNKSATETQTPSRLRTFSPVAKTVTNTQTPSSSKSAGYARSLSATETQTPSRARGLGETKSATQTQTASRARAAGLTRSAIQTAAAAMARAVGMTRTGSTSSTPSENHPGGGTNTPKTLSGTQTQTPTLQRVVGVVRTALDTAAAATQRAVSKGLSATDTQAPAVAKSRARTFTAVHTQSGSLVKGQGFFRNLSATHTQTPSRAPNAVGKPISATETQTPSRTRAVGRTVTAGEAQAPSLSKGGLNTLTLTVSQLQASAVAKGLGMGRAALETQTGTRARAMASTLAAIALQAPSRLRSITRRLVYTATQTGQQQGGGSSHTPVEVSAVQVQSPFVTLVPHINTPITGGTVRCRTYEQRVTITIETMSNALEGTKRRIAAEFSDFDGEPADPDTATVTINGDSQPMTRLHRGLWVYDFLPPAAGVYKYQVAGTGHVYAAGEGLITVRSYR